MPDMTTTPASPAQVRVGRLHLAHHCAEPIGEYLGNPQDVNYDGAEDYEFPDRRLDSESDLRQRAYRILEIADMLDGGPVAGWIREVAVEEVARLKAHIAEPNTGKGWDRPLALRVVQYSVDASAGLQELLALEEVAA